MTCLQPDMPLGDLFIRRILISFCKTETDALCNILNEGYVPRKLKIGKNPHSCIYPAT
jgi:hypothetical protein